MGRPQAVWPDQPIHFHRKPAARAVWLEELYIRPPVSLSWTGKRVLAYVDEQIAPKVMRLRLEIEPITYLGPETLSGNGV